MADAPHACVHRLEPGVLPGDGRTALVIAHPGHELRIHGVLERFRPRTYVLTDGAGPSAASRVPSTTQVLVQVGARRGEIYGALADVSLYELLRTGRWESLCQLVGVLADSWIRHEIAAVIGDAADCYNPAHDVCRLIIDAAVRIVERRCGARPANYDFQLIGRPEPAYDVSGSMHFELDGGELRRKLAASHGYIELAAEVAAALNRWGADAFRAEYLRPVTRLASVAPPPGQTPFYEVHGARRVASGCYPEVIRYHTHLLPLAQRLEQWVREHAA